jgi:hypothetical protein
LRASCARARSSGLDYGLPCRPRLGAAGSPQQAAVLDRSRCTGSGQKGHSLPIAHVHALDREVAAEQEIAVTPVEIVGKLNEEINAVLADPKVKARFPDRLGGPNGGIREVVEKSTLIDSWDDGLFDPIDWPAPAGEVGGARGGR